MKKYRWAAYSSVIVVLTIILFSSCKKSDAPEYNQNVAGLMAVNLATDQVVTMNISGNTFTYPLGPGNYNGGYAGIYPGKRMVEAVSAYNYFSVASATYEFEVNKAYSSFIVGSDSLYQNVIVNDNIDSTDANGKAFVRFINAIPGSKETTVAIGSSAAKAAVYAQVSPFEGISAGDLAVQLKGDSISANRNINFEAKKVYTILLLPGENKSDSVQIKYIINGAYDDLVNSNESRVSGTMKSSAASAVR